MEDQPSTAELVAAVEDFIRNVAMEKLEGHAQFHARVAANALAIVKRSLELAPDQSAAETARLTELLDRNGDLEALNRALCEQIRGGGVGLDNSALQAHLWRTTLEKLAIDQPKYSGYRRALGDL